jgi:chaperone protein EcpD
LSIRRTWRAAFAACVLAAAASAAHASVVLNGTRVIYQAKEREVTLKLSNEGDTPALVQTWVDDGNANALPDDTKVPFTLTPPLFRLDPKKGQTLRIIYTQEPLPQDRESLFWLNVLEVPPVASAAPDAANSLQLAFRSRIKLFFRPAGLPGDANDAPAQVSWKFVRRAAGGYALAATNPTPYHVTFSTVAARTGGATYRNERGAMVAPHATVEIDLGQIGSVSGELPAEVDYTTINDYGAGVAGSFRASPQRP